MDPPCTVGGRLVRRGTVQDGRTGSRLTALPGKAFPALQGSLQFNYTSLFEHDKRNQNGRGNFSVFIVIATFSMRLKAS